MPQVAELWSRPNNFAIVQLPERAFPGVVVQGDTLNTLVGQLERMNTLLGSNQLEELAEEIEDMRDRLADARVYYETVCSARGVALPYPKESR